MEEDKRVKITIMVQSPNGLDPGVPDWLERGLTLVWDLEVEGVEVEEG